MIYRPALLPLGTPDTASLPSRGADVFRLYHPWYNSRVPSPLVPTLALQLAAVACLVTAAACGAATERHRSGTLGAITVAALLCAALLVAVLAFRMTR